MRGLAIIVTVYLVLTAGMAAADENLEATARKALIAFTEAVIAGPEAVAPMLAPEYQIMRANGVSYDREGYIATVGGVSAKRDFAHEDLFVTRADDIMVVRYFLRIDETIDGAEVESRAPRLTVFRKIGDTWTAVAHSNFGATAPPQ